MKISQRYILLGWSSHWGLVRFVPTTETSRDFESQKASRAVLCMLSTRSNRAVETLYGLPSESEELRQERKSTTDYDYRSFGLAGGSKHLKWLSCDKSLYIPPHTDLDNREVCVRCMKVYHAVVEAQNTRNAGTAYRSEIISRCCILRHYLQNTSSEDC